MAIRVLDVLNFSNLRNPEADSGVRLQKELLTAILQKRPDFFFYLLIPHELKSSYETCFAGKNVQLIPCSVATRQQGGAYDFNARELSAILDLRRIDVDVLFINQPELTPAFLEFFNKVHFFDIHSFGYIHWMDWKRADNIKNRWNLPSNLSLLTSILLSTMTGCNSRYGRERILREAAKWFNPSALREIEKKLIPLWPGINCAEILAARTRARHGLKTIVFPCRTQKYTGFKSLVEIHLAGLWRKRRDFRLLLTNPSDYDYVKHYPRRFPFVEVCRLNRQEYLGALWMADIVVGCHTGANQWSLGVVEAMAAECIPLLNKSSFFDEMLSAVVPLREREEMSKRYFYYRQAFANRLENLLDNLEHERKRARLLGQRIRDFYSWERRVDQWIQCFEAADAASPSITVRSRMMRQIERFVSRKRKCSKASILNFLSWHPKSRHISWTKYRKRLRECFVEVPGSALVVFVRRKKVRPRISRWGAGSSARIQGRTG